jgi:hypothetical protein
MYEAGIESTIPVFKQENTVLGLDWTATGLVL